MSNISLYGFIMYICGYLAIMISGFIFGLLIYLNCASDKIDKEPIIKKSKNDEIIYFIECLILQFIECLKTKSKTLS